MVAGGGARRRVVWARVHVCDGVGSGVSGDWSTSFFRTGQLTKEKWKKMWYIRIARAGVKAFTFRAYETVYAPARSTLDAADGMQYLEDISKDRGKGMGTYSARDSKSQHGEEIPNRTLQGTRTARASGPGQGQAHKGKTEGATQGRDGRVPSIGKETRVGRGGGGPERGGENEAEGTVTDGKRVQTTARDSIRKGMRRDGYESIGKASVRSDVKNEKRKDTVQFFTGQ
ncbi:hypothetical protein B0H19DRAFT_1083563 [Mycena capillaripes]|nr:hypothetical protein B0H19DRAFT_1083563 [Mycena capillaripes]